MSKQKPNALLLIVARQSLAIQEEAGAAMHAAAGIQRKHRQLSWCLSAITALELSSATMYT